jgi:ParB family chromosome partitioning protein
MKTYNFKQINLTEIYIGKSNPRTNFDQEAIKELSASIKEIGVTQPIAVRIVKGKAGYELISGERRFKASNLVAAEFTDRKTIPAMVYEDLSDLEVLEMQIAENLQRVDPHPMDEAVAYKGLAEKGMDTQEIANRLGKKYFYIAQRLRLNMLIEPIQKAFYEDRCSLTVALKLCQFEDKVQKEIYNNQLKNISGTWHIQNINYSHYTGELKNAQFDTEDLTLNKAMGACSACQYNTAAAGSLFPDENKAARCLKNECFKIKANNHFNREFEKAKNDPLMELVSDRHYTSTIGDKLIKSGVKVYSANQYTQIQTPTPPDIASYKQMLKNKHWNSEAEMQEAYDKDLEAYTKKLNAFEKKTSDGHYIKGFVIEGTYPGRYIYLTLDKKENKGLNTKGKGKTDKDGAPVFTAEDIKGEITRIQEREKRSKELDEEKIYPQVFELLSKKTPAFKAAGVKDLQVNELIALVILLEDQLSHPYGNEFKKISGFKGESYNTCAFYNFLVSKSPKILQGYVNALTRILVLNKFEGGQHTRMSRNDGAAVLTAIARDYNKTGIEAIFKVQNEIAATREGRVNTRLANLKKQLKDVPVKAGPDKKKAAKKK